MKINPQIKTIACALTCHQLLLSADAQAQDMTTPAAVNSALDMGAGSIATADTTALGTVAAVPDGSATGFMASLTPLPARAGEFHMQPVHAVHARVQSEEPVFDAAHQQFVSRFQFPDFAKSYEAMMDGVNTASIEGALMYVQAEGINYNTRSSQDRCRRKNNMKYVVFYDVAIAQTNETLALYQDTADQNEYGPMIPMDEGRCSPTDTVNGKDILPKECYYFNGDDGEPNIGPFVGGESKSQDVRAPYPDNYWFSFPNTCPLKKWSEKTAACRAKSRKGLCSPGVMPDGVTCTFAYRMMGYIPIDDVVGITHMTSNTTGKPFTDFNAFCEDGGVEFKASEHGEWEDGLIFWANPQDEEANAKRGAHLIEVYQNLTSGWGVSTLVDAGTVALMAPLPALTQLAAENPPCYENVKRCSAPQQGCRRETFSQLCRLCGDNDTTGCTYPPDGFVFPALKKAVGKNGSKGNADKNASRSEDDDHVNGNRNSDGGDGKSASLSTRVNFSWMVTVVLGAITFLVLSTTG